MVESKESACNAVHLGLIPGSGRSPGEGNSNPLQYSCLENPMDRGAWAIIYGVAKIPWRREWLPTPAFLPGEFHGERSLVVAKELDTTEQLTLSLLHFPFQLSLLLCELAP